MLATYVECFWELVSDGAPQRVLPDGAMDVLFVLGDGAARVIGPMTRPRVTEPRGPTAIAGARFRPGAALELLGVGARDLRDARPSCATRGERAAARSRPASPTLAARALRSSRSRQSSRLAWHRRAPRNPRLARAVETLRAAGGELPFPAVSDGVGLSERQLERLFEERVGYGPKLFARVVRLEEIDAGNPAQRRSHRLVAQPGHRQRVLRSGAPGAGVSGAHGVDSRGVCARARHVGNRQSPGASADYGRLMNITKVTPVRIVERIEPCLGFWCEGLGYEKRVEVPHGAQLGFVLLGGAAGEVMLQTRASLADESCRRSPPGSPT